MIRHSLLFASALALAACGNVPEPAPQPAQEPTPVVAPEPVATHSPPNEELFKTLFAETCPRAKPVNTAFCKHSMGSDNATCEFGLGKDNALRNRATLTLNEDEWALKDPERVCSL